ncbi:hypothetical protein JW859_07040 [bacterium]|nr:hypothetical protein [bacterium]
MHKATWILLAWLVLMLAGCGGSSQVPPAMEEQSAGLQTAADWPALPTEAKQSGMVEGAVFTGDDAAVIQAEYNTSIPAAGVLQLDATTPGDELAWVVYQVPDPVGAGELAALTVDVQYLDPDPLLARPEEGYYVGWGDYDNELWQWSGPYTGRQARVQYPAGAGLLGPGNKLAAAVVVVDGIVQINSVQVGRDVGEAYDEVTLGGIPGRSAGALCDLQLAPDGNPQIAYQLSPIVQGQAQAEICVAAKNGATWEKTSVEPQDSLEWFRLALGSGGRRALLVCENNDAVIYFDTGDGVFDDRKVLSGGVEYETMGGLTFVNGTGLPDGELDTALAVYGNEDSGDIRVAYRTYDGTTLVAEDNVLPAASETIGRIALTPTADRQAIVAISDEDGGDQICRVGHYTPGAWNFPAAEEWGPLEDVEEWESFTPGVIVRERPGGGLIGGYLGDDRAIVHLGYFDGTTWTSSAADSVTTSVIPVLSLDAFSSGRAVFLGLYGEYLPALHWGMTGSGDAYFTEYLAAEPYDAYHSSLAIDDANNVHIAGFNMKTGELYYFLRPPSAPLERELVDNGGMSAGMSYYVAWPVYAAGQLHVFCLDLAHMRIAHSVNENGSWVVENELLDAGCLPYILTGAGYLEEKNLLYLTVFPMDAAETYVVSGTPGGGDWRAVPFIGAFGIWSNVGDDEAEIGTIGRQVSINSQNKLVFAKGDPRAAATTMKP